MHEPRPMPMVGVRVCELGIAIAAPTCTRHLGFFGADVIKLESRNNPDVVRIFGTVWAREDPSLAAAMPDLSAYVTEMTTGKRSVGLDLKHPDGLAAAKRVIAASDVFVTNYSTPAVRALGLDPDSLRSVRPDLIHVALPGFGSDPSLPYYDRVAWGPNQAPLVGLDNLTGHPDREPVGIGPIAPPDYWSGLLATTAVLAALSHRDRTGEGSVVDLSQFEASVGLLGPFLLDHTRRGYEQQRIGSRSLDRAPQGVYPSLGDDRWVAISVDSDASWEAMSDVLGLRAASYATVSERQAAHDEIDARIAAWTRVRSAHEAAATLQATGIAAHAVAQLDDVLFDPQYRSRRAFGVAPSTRIHRDVFTATPMRLSSTPAVVRRAGAVMGEDTFDVLVEVAGFSRDEVDALAKAGAAFVPALPGVTCVRPYDAYLDMLIANDPPIEQIDPVAGIAVSLPPGAPFAGVRVVDLGGLCGDDAVCSAYGTMLLAGLGADVVLVEPPDGSALRRRRPSDAWHAYLDRGKRSVVVDVDTDEGRARLDALVAGADVVFDPSRVDAPLAPVRDDAVWVSVTPFGLTGPHRHWKGSDLVGWAAAGILGLTGYPDDPPVLPGGPVDLAAHVTALYATVAALLALRARQRDPHGRGQHVDIAMNECLLAIAPETGVTMFLDDGIRRTRTGNRRALARPWGLYPCSDGHVSAIVLQPAHWRAVGAWISEVTGNDLFLDPTFDDLAMRAQIQDVIDDAFAEVTARSTKRELFAEGQRRNVPVTPLNTLADLRADPHLVASGFFGGVDAAARSGDDGDGVPGPPFRVDHAWWSFGPTAALGEHDATDGGRLPQHP